MRDEHIEAMDEILRDAGVDTDNLKIKEIAQAFIDHMNAMREMESYSHISSKSECEKCAIKDREIKELKEEIEIYKGSVKKRRNASSVYIDKYTKSVLYDI